MTGLDTRPSEQPLPPGRLALAWVEILISGALTVASTIAVTHADGWRDLLLLILLAFASLGGLVVSVLFALARSRPPITLRAIRYGGAVGLAIAVLL